MRILVDVDIQNDFCDPRGALFVPGSPNELFRRIVASAVARQMPIVGSVDSHAFDAWEFASSGRTGPSGESPAFPDHCVKGTWGWLKVDGTLPQRFRFVPNVPGLDATSLASELFERCSQGVYFEKEVYSLFANPNAERVLAALAELSGEPLSAVVFGVATDYCVKAAALGLCDLGIETFVLMDAVREIAPDGKERALAEMREAGAKLTTASDLLGIA
jgi:nicotinamidase/pyrazinamidase